MRAYSTDYIRINDHQELSSLAALDAGRTQLHFPEANESSETRRNEKMCTNVLCFPFKIKSKYGEHLYEANAAHSDSNEDK